MKITVRCCVGLWLHLFPMIVSLEWNAKAKMKMKFAMIVKYTIRTSVIEHTLFKMVHDNCDRTLIDHYVPRQCAAIYYNESSQKGRCEHVIIYWCYSPAIIKTTEKIIIITLRAVTTQKTKTKISIAITFGLMHNEFGMCALCTQSGANERASMHSIAAHKTDCVCVWVCVFRPIGNEKKKSRGMRIKYEHRGQIHSFNGLF